MKITAHSQICRRDSAAAGARDRRQDADAGIRSGARPACWSARDRRRAGIARQGFTLIELMVAVAIIGILVATAVVGVRKSEYGRTVNGFAQQIGSQADRATMRAIQTRRWQQLEVLPDQILHWEATTQGLGTPTAWRLVHAIPAPQGVNVAMTSPRAHLAAADAVPAEGVGIPAIIQFHPDGSADSAMTVFVRDTAGRESSRVAIIRSTGAAYIFSGW